MKTLKPSHVVFINGMTTHGDRIRAYMEAYPRSSAAAAKANACRLMKKEAIRQHIDRYFEIEEAENDRRQIELRKKRFTDFMDSQELLWDIANGHPIKKTTAAGLVVLKYPTISERLSAIFIALGNEKRFLREYPQYTSWLEDEIDDEKDTVVAPWGKRAIDEDAQHEVRNLLLPRQQRLSIYLQHVSPVSLYRKGL